MSRAPTFDQPMLNPGQGSVRHTGLLVYSTACALLMAAILLTNWPTYAYAVRGGMLPLYYYALPGLLIVPILFAHPDAALRFLREPILWWFVAFVVSAILWQIMTQDFAEEANRTFRLRLLMFLVFITLAIVMSESRGGVIALAIIFCVLLSGALSWFDALRPHRIVPEGHVDAMEGRGAGLFLNPNVAASFVVMGTIAALPYIPMRLRAVALTGAVMCVAPTFSRGAFVLIAVAVVVGAVTRLLNRTQIVLSIVAVPLLVGGLGLAYDYLMANSEDRNMRRVVQRLMIFQKADADEDQSVDLRADAAGRAWELFTQEPVFGAGIARTTSAEFVIGPHNMYMMLMAEQGIFGLVFYLGLIVVVAQRGWWLMRYVPDKHLSDVGRALVVLASYIAVQGFFSHNVLDEPQAMFVLAFLIAAAARARRYASTYTPTDHPPALRVRPALRLVRR